MASTRSFVVALLLLPAAPASAMDDGAGAPDTAAGQEAVMTARGFIRDRGAWRTPQEIELIERAERTNLAEKQWVARLRRLRKQVDEPGSAADAAEEIRETVDPHAVPALAEAVAAEPVQRIRGWYLEALRRIGSPDAIRTLFVAAIDHADAETRLVAAEQLVAGGHATIVVPMAVAVLGDPANVRVNRAADLLGRLGDASAAAALIETLETRHAVTTSDGGPEGSTTATFTPSGGGLSLGGGNKTRMMTVRNPSVHDALVALCGVDFQWDTTAWRAWLANRDAPAGFDPRRGEIR